MTNHRHELPDEPFNPDEDRPAESIEEPTDEQPADEEPTEEAGDRYHQ